MKAGLVGYAQTGKTTLFNALTGLDVQTGAGRAASANLGVLKVPDPRIDKLSAMYKPKKTIFAEVSLVDVPGPRTKGGGLESTVIQALREADALVVVLRGFEAGEKSDPVRELNDFDAELVLNDQMVVERRLERIAKEKGHEREKAVLDRCMAALGDGQALRLAGLTADDEREISSYAFLSLRPLLAVLNVGEADAGKDLPAALQKAAADKKLEVLSVCGSIEAEISTLPAGEQAEFLAGMGIAEPASARLIRAVYHLLDYISFFTVGEDEVRAWNVHRGDKAPRAAGRVHSDIERGFIRAEVMKYGDLIELGSEVRMKETGKLHIEGKEYVVLDGDILHFRFNV